MKENKLGELSMEFAVDIITLEKKLKTQRESIISNQIGRSKTPGFRGFYYCESDLGE